MIVLMFRPQWVELILQGRKVQTIRPIRRRVVRVGDVLSLRVWMGRPYCSKQKALLETRCTSVDSVVIDDGGVGMLSGDRSGQRLSWEHMERLARRDGFDDFDAMQKFFREMHGLPFNGTVIGWVS